MTPADKKRAQTHRAWAGIVTTPEFDEFLSEYNWRITTRELPLPHDDGAECALLGALVFGTDEDWEERHPATLARIRPHHFYYGEHGTILIAVARLYQRQMQGKGGRVDVVEVASDLRQAGKLIDDDASIWVMDKAGRSKRELVRRSYLFNLWEQCPSTVNVVAYTDTVLKCARLRALHEVGHAVQNLITGEQAPQGQHDYCEMGGQPLGSDPAQIINSLRRALDEIDTRGTTDTAIVFNTNK